MECKKQKAREWQIRLQEDIRHNQNAKFVTLTFSNKSIKHLAELEELKYLKGYELDNAIATKAVRLFLERWRKKYKKSLRHWLVTELGHNGTENIHLHGIVYTDNMDEVERIWNYGWVWKGNEKLGKIENYVSDRTINYIVKYIHKQDTKHTAYKSKVLTSAGIGGGYTKRTDILRNKYKEEGTNEAYRTRKGNEVSLPIYWRNKIYTDDEKEKLWIEKLDKNERWVSGVKIDISQGQEEYYKVLEEARKKAKRLGYGDNNTHWSRKQYEEERRNLLTKERIEKATNQEVKIEEQIKNIPRSKAWE